MQLPGVHIVTLKNPVLYTTRQIEDACTVAHYLNRGEFILCAEPEREQ